jgi:hypothetical protein
MFAIAAKIRNKNKREIFSESSPRILQPRRCVALGRVPQGRGYSFESAERLVDRPLRQMPVRLAPMLLSLRLSRQI